MPTVEEDGKILFASALCNLCRRRIPGRRTCASRHASALKRHFPSKRSAGCQQANAMTGICHFSTTAGKTCPRLQCHEGQRALHPARRRHHGVPAGVNHAKAAYPASHSCRLCKTAPARFAVITSPEFLRPFFKNCYPIILKAEAARPLRPDKKSWNRAFQNGA